nr:hypothetical protein [Tanacetum cinerariifolium]
MRDKNPIRALRDYSKPSHEGCKNTIELPIGNNVVPIRPDTIQLVQYGCPFHGLWSEDPNQHLKDFLKLVDSLDLDGSITIWEDLTTRFLAQFFQPDLLQKVPHHGIDLCLQVQILYDHVNPATRQTIDQSANGKLRDRNAKESWPLLEDLTLDDNESWNDPIDFAKPVKAIALPQDVPSTSDRRPIEYCMEDPKQAFVEYASSCTDEAGGSCVNIISLYLFKKLNIRLLKETDHIFGLADGTKSYPVGIVKDVEVHIGKLKLLNDFYMIDMKKDPETPLLVGRGFLATANVVIDYRKAKIAVGEGITRLLFAREWEIDRDVKLNPFKDVLVFRRKVEFLGSIPINLKSNMWDSEDFIKNLINWDKPPKNEDGAWHAKIRLIDPDEEEFTKTLQSIPTTRKLFERESPREIIDLYHFYDT